MRSGWGRQEGGFPVTGFADGQTLVRQAGQFRGCSQDGKLHWGGDSEDREVLGKGREGSPGHEGAQKPGAVPGGLCLVGIGCIHTTHTPSSSTNPLDVEQRASITNVAK